MVRKLPQTISEQEFLEGLKKVSNPKRKLALMLGFYQCMRISEIVGLKKQISRCCKADINKDRKKQANGNLKVIYTCSRCNKTLSSKDMVRHLTEWQIEPLTKADIDFNRGFIHIKNAKFSKDRDIPIMKPVLNGLKHLPIDVKARQLELDVKKIYPGHHFHELRHSGASYYLNEKHMEIRFLQIFLGHSNIASTQIYTHVNPDQLKKRFEEINW